MKSLKTCKKKNLVSFLKSQTGASDVGSGDYGRYITDSRLKDEDGFDIDDSDYDIFIEEVGYYVSQLGGKIF